MTRTGSAQRARRLLSQATMQRSHRRGELIRVIPEVKAVLSTPLSGNDAEQTPGEQKLTASPESDEAV
jgi:hypothetical protein